MSTEVLQEELSQKNLNSIENETLEKLETSKNEFAENDSTNDPYAYLQREFSSEKFKIEIKNLPKFYGINELRKLLNDKLKLASNKIKTPRRNSPYIFVCFRNEEDRMNALKLINDFKWKGKSLIAHKAKPAPDPLVKKRKADNESESPVKKVKITHEMQEENLKNSTVPLWNMSYDEQLKLKQNEIKKMLGKLGNNLIHHNYSLKSWISQQKSLYNDLSCELLDIRYSSQYEGYRNKCEFTVGIDEVTGLSTVGFRIGSYSTGVTGVGPIDDLNHIPKSMKTAVKFYQDFIRNSELEVFNPEVQTGHFRQLAVRTAPGQLMLIIGVHPQNLSEEELNKLKSNLIKFFTEGTGKEANVTSLYFQPILKRISGENPAAVEYLCGDTHIYETILGLKFRISAEAFFQINSLGAEVLYNAAIELAQPTQVSTVVDICCGTGTIGLCFAKSCAQVLGLEVVRQAVIDAKENAKTNDIANCEFFEGKAEDILSSVLYRANTDDVIAIVDPPRAGLHQRAVLQLRKAKKIKKLIYVSCNPAAAMKNFIDLGRPSSKTMFGEPFVPIKAIPVDMFPDTRHCELIILFQRWDESMNFE